METRQSFALASKVKDYFQLIKFTLSFMVVFSCVVCYLLAPNMEFDLLSVLLLFFAGMLITGSANAINQAVEKETDAMMKRTASRPVASGRMTENEAWGFALITGVIGVIIMWQWFNFAERNDWFGEFVALCFCLHATEKSQFDLGVSWSISGSLPCLIGWVAATNEFSAGGWVLFAIQFLWQFPHFWAIAWVAHQDYSRAGFKLLPSATGPTKFTALQTVMYSLLMVPVGLLPYYFKIVGSIALHGIWLVTFGWYM